MYVERRGRQQARVAARRWLSIDTLARRRAEEGGGTSRTCAYGDAQRPWRLVKHTERCHSALHESPNAQIDCAPQLARAASFRGDGKYAQSKYTSLISSWRGTLARATHKEVQDRMQALRDPRDPRLMRAVVPAFCAGVGDTNCQRCNTRAPSTATLPHVVVIDLEKSGSITAVP